MNETQNKIGTWVGFVFILVWCLLPVVWIISLSFKGPTETAAGSPQFLPKDPTFENYGRPSSDEPGRRTSPGR